MKGPTPATTGGCGAPAASALLDKVRRVDGDLRAVLDHPEGPQGAQQAPRGSPPPP